jgi:hypothetical protein
VTPEKPAALAGLFSAELQLIESLNIHENLHMRLRVTVSNLPGFQ